MSYKCLYIPHRNIRPIIDNNTSVNWTLIKWNRLLTFYSYLPPYCIIDLLIIKFLEAYNFRLFLSINWISPTEKLMQRLADKSDKIFTATLQHGAYGGLVFPKDIENEMYISSDIFLVWGPIFRDFFQKFNPKNSKILIFGNPAYIGIQNCELIDAWVIALSHYPKRNIGVWYCIKQQLENLGKKVFIKLHKKDEYLKRFFDFSDLTDLSTNNFTGVVTDFSTVVLDAMVAGSELILYDDLNPINDEIRTKSIFGEQLNISNSNQLFINTSKSYSQYIPLWVDLNTDYNLENILL